MRRFIPMLTLAGLLVLVGFFVAAPNARTASAYPSAITSFDAPTARPEGCVFPQTCYNGQYCLPSQDPEEGCEYNLAGGGCTGCII